MTVWINFPIILSWKWRFPVRKPNSRVKMLGRFSGAKRHMEPLLVLLFYPKWRTGLQQQNETKIIEFDQKLAELWVVLGPNLTLKYVFGGHLGSRDLECRSKVTNILMFFWKLNASTMSLQSLVEIHWVLFDIYSTHCSSPYFGKIPSDWA